jgi:hypothetical protein
VVDYGEARRSSWDTTEIADISYTFYQHSSFPRHSSNCRAMPLQQIRAYAYPLFVKTILSRSFLRSTLCCIECLLYFNVNNLFASFSNSSIEIFSFYFMHALPRTISAAKLLHCSLPPMVHGLQHVNHLCYLSVSLTDTNSQKNTTMALSGDTIDRQQP